MARGYKTEGNEMSLKNVLTGKRKTRVDERMKVPDSLKKPKNAVLGSYDAEGKRKGKPAAKSSTGGTKPRNNTPAKPKPEPKPKPKYTHGKQGSGTEGPSISKGKLRKRRVMEGLKSAWRNRSGDAGRKAFGID